MSLRILVPPSSVRAHARKGEITVVGDSSPPPRGFNHQVIWPAACLSGAVRAHREGIMRLLRRKFLRLATGAPLLAAVQRTALGQTARPLAERLADYADRLRFDDLDAATVERVKA